MVDNKIIIEPLEDILSLEGILSKKAKKNKTISQIIRAEKRAFAKANVDIVDIFLYVSAKKDNAAVLSFDKDFDKLKEKSML